MNIYDFPDFCLCSDPNAQSILEHKKMVRMYMIDDLANIVFEYCKINFINVQIYTINYNILHVESGMSGLCYSN